MPYKELGLIMKNGRVVLKVLSKEQMGKKVKTSALFFNLI
jgi:hypothetical protein